MHRANLLTLNYPRSRLKRHMKVLQKRKRKRDLRYFLVHSTFSDYLDHIYTKAVKSVFAPQKKHAVGQY